MIVGLLLRDTVIPVLVAEVPTPKLSALGFGLETDVVTLMLILGVVRPAETLTAVGLVSPLLVGGGGGLLLPVVVEGVPVPPPQPALRMIESKSREIKKDSRISTLMFSMQSCRCRFAVGRRRD